MKQKGNEMMEKVVIIINGNGGVGKDTLCEFAAAEYNVTNISAITPVKNIATQYGWNGEKDAKSRKFLADLKQIFSEYNDLPTRYLVEEYRRFLDSESRLLFVHIREGEEIDKFRSQVEVPCAALLIRRHNMDHKCWGNESDDNVDNYTYDYYYDNDKPLEEAKPDFLKFVQKLINGITRRGPGEGE